MLFELSLPGCGVNTGQRCKLGFGHRQALPIQILEPWHPPEIRFHSSCATANPLNDPLQNAHVVAKPWPQEFACLIAAEPVDAEDMRPVRVGVAHPDPMIEVVAHVVATEGQHGEGVAADDTLLTD